jgi:hypothetical protein
MRQLKLYWIYIIIFHNFKWHFNAHNYFINLWSNNFFNSSYNPYNAPGLFFSSAKIFTQTVGLIGRVISPSQGRYLYKGQHKHRKNHTQTSMTWVGFERPIPAFEKTKTSHASDRAATMIDYEPMKAKNNLCYGKPFRTCAARILYLTWRSL